MAQRPALVPRRAPPPAQGLAPSGELELVGLAPAEDTARLTLVETTPAPAPPTAPATLRLLGDEPRGGAPRFEGVTAPPGAVVSLRPDSPYVSPVPAEVPPPTPAPVPGMLDLSVDAEDAEVWLNGQRLSPGRQQLSLRPGVYEIKASAPGRVPERATVTIAAGLTTRVPIELEVVEGPAPDDGPLATTSAPGNSSLSQPAPADITAPAPRVGISTGWIFVIGVGIMVAGIVAIQAGWVEIEVESEPGRELERSRKSR